MARAKEIMRMPGPGGGVGHAEMQLGDSRIMLADEYPDMDFLAPSSRGGSPVHIHLYVPDADKMAAQAVKAGAKLLRPVEEQFYGDRIGTLQDAWGHVWHLATHVRDVSMAELRKASERRAEGK
jgi:PhnB protein